MHSRTDQYITFKLAGEQYAINVSQVREVLDVSHITRIPGAPEFVRGVVNVRGQAIPVVDLRQRFGLPPAESTIHSRILVMELDCEGGQAVVGGMADSVHEVIELTASELIEAPKLSASTSISESILGMGRRGDEFLIVLEASAELFSAGATSLAAA